MPYELIPGDSTRWRDVAAIHEAAAAAAYAHIFSGPFPAQEAAERWQAYEGSLLLALHDGLPVAFAAWSGQQLDALYVLPQHTSRGLGTQLLGALPASVDALWVLVENTRGRGFYERRGWLGTGEMREAYGPVKEVLYRR